MGWTRAVIQLADALPAGGAIPASYQAFVGANGYVLDRMIALLDEGIAVVHRRLPSGCPPGRQRLRLLQHRPRRLLLLVGRVSVLAKDAADQPAQVGAHVLA